MCSILSSSPFLVFDFGDVLSWYHDESDEAIREL